MTFVPILFRQILKKATSEKTYLILLNIYIYFSTSLNQSCLLLYLQQIKVSDKDKVETLFHTFFWKILYKMIKQSNWFKKKKLVSFEVAPNINVIIINVYNTIIVVYINIVSLQGLKNIKRLYSRDHNIFSDYAQRCSLDLCKHLRWRVLQQ